ncbi:hypothetical protein ES705_32500 [subsurface metagenome]
MLSLSPVAFTSGASPVAAFFMVISLIASTTDSGFNTSLLLLSTIPLVPKNILLKKPFNQFFIVVPRVPSPSTLGTIFFIAII